MHFAAFFCAAVTKQRGKQLLELMMRFGPKSNNMNTVQRGQGGGGSNRTRVWSDQAIKPSVKAPLHSLFYFYLINLFYFYLYMKKLDHLKLAPSILVIFQLLVFCLFNTF